MIVIIRLIHYHINDDQFRVSDLPDIKITNESHWDGLRHAYGIWVNAVHSTVFFVYLKTITVVLPSGGWDESQERSEYLMSSCNTSFYQYGCCIRKLPRDSVIYPTLHPSNFSGRISCGDWSSLRQRQPLALFTENDNGLVR